MGSLPVYFANEDSFIWPPDHLWPRVTYANEAKAVTGPLSGLVSDQRTGDK
jgi:hypothetical protein